MNRTPAIIISVASVALSFAVVPALLVGMGWITSDAVSGAANAAWHQSGPYFSLMLKHAAAEWPHYVITLLASFFLAGIIYKVLRQSV